MPTLFLLIHKDHGKENALFVLFYLIETAERLLFWVVEGVGGWIHKAFFWQYPVTSRFQALLPNTTMRNTELQDM